MKMNELCVAADVVGGIGMSLWGMLQYVSHIECCWQQFVNAVEISLWHMREVELVG